jgi:hypothetical protein
LEGSRRMGMATLAASSLLRKLGCADPLARNDEPA